MKGGVNLVKIIRSFLKKGMSIFGILLLLSTFCSCYADREREYYSDKSNYITEQAIVDSISYDEKAKVIYLRLSEIDESYPWSGFAVKGESVAVALDNGVLEKVTSGCEITFTSAPGCYSNGYYMPIVALSVNDEEILGFEEGYANLLDHLD